MSNIKYGFLEMTWKKGEEECSDHKCDRVIAFDQLCYIDVMYDKVYCDMCGPCERYARKKEMQRKTSE